MNYLEMEKFSHELKLFATENFHCKMRLKLFRTTIKEHAHG